jgi:hypothetical protein
MIDSQWTTTPERDGIPQRAPPTALHAAIYCQLPDTKLCHIRNGSGDNSHGQTECLKHHSQPHADHAFSLINDIG